MRLRLWCIGLVLLASGMLGACRERERPAPYPPGYPAVPHPPNPVFVPLPIPKPVPVPQPPPPPVPTPTPPPPPPAPPPPPPPSPTPSATAPQPAKPLSWVGAYGFNEACGTAAGSTGVVVGHVLRVYRKAGVLMAELDADGFQTRTRLRALAKPQENVLVIAFDDHAPDDLFKTAYKRGETLITLVRMQDKMLTLWGSYKPACTDGTGQEYFTRQGG